MQMMKRSGQDLELDQHFIYGPSILLDKVEVDSNEYAPPAADPHKVTIKSEIVVALSCPYVFTYSTAEGTWINEGRILAGREGAARESFDSKYLSDFNGTVIIKELESEHTFIDTMYVRAVAENGDSVILWPDDDTLFTADHKYLELQKGEQIRVKFRLPHHLGRREYYLVMKGYYVAER
jgi:hypothetical protein